MFNNNGNTIPRNGLVGEWLLDGSRLDTSGNGYNGTASNVTYVKTTKGYQAQAGSFNGSSSYITISDNVNLRLTNNFSIFATIYTGAISRNNGIIGKDQGTLDNTKWKFLLNSSNKLTFTISAVADIDDTGPALELNKWYNVGIVHTGTSWKFYVNGNLNSDITNTNNPGTSTSPLYIGTGQNITYPYQGYIQDARIYNRVLSQDEIQLLYLEGQKKLGPSNIRAYPKLLDGLVGYWDFKGTAHNLVDGVNATITGATLTTDRFGYTNSAYSFDGVNDKIYVPYSAGLNITGSTTFSRRVKFNAMTSVNQLVVLKGNISVDWGFGIQVNNASTGIQFITSTGTDKALSSNIVPVVGQYYHIVAVFNSTGNMTIFIDGVQVATTTCGTTLRGSSSYGRTFGNDYADANDMNGVMDEAILFNRALSADEVKTLYQLTSQDYIYPSQSYDLLNLRDGLVLDLNEQGKDLSGNGNNGTLVNAPQVVRQGKTKGLSYNGSNQYLTSSYSPNITSPITFSGWYKTSANYSTTSGVILGKFNGGHNYWVGLNTSNILTFYVGGSSNLVISDNIATNDNKWYKYDAVYDGTNIKLYRDGILKQTLASGTCSPIGNLRFATFGDVLGHYFNGNITSPKIRNRALSAKEIEQLYYSQKRNFVY